jgi:oligosaccharide translocation protein RFT1
MSTILSTSLKGASYLIFVQVFTRAITFVVNQLLLRLLSPELLGISAQLELYSITVLYFSRESIRVACQRQTSNPQAVVNVAYLTVVFGIPLSVLLASLYSSVQGYGVAYFSEALALYTAACVIELFAEPAFVTSQQGLHFSVRASAETLATVSRCFSTCAAALWANRSGASLGALPFALGQLSYSLVLLAVYAVQVAPLASSAAYSLLPRRIIK